MLLRTVVALTLLASPLAAQSEVRWVQVAASPDEVISIDTASVTALGDSVYRIWERYDDPRSKTVRAVSRADFDCRLRLTRVVAINLPGYQSVPASEDERQWTEIVPGSVYEAELRRVCPAGAPR